MAVSFLSGELNLTWGRGNGCSGRILAPGLTGCVIPRNSNSLSPPLSGGGDNRSQMAVLLQAE